MEGLDIANAIETGLVTKMTPEYLSRRNRKEKQRRNIVSQIARKTRPSNRNSDGDWGSPSRAISLQNRLDMLRMRLNRNYNLPPTPRQNATQNFSAGSEDFGERTHVASPRGPQMCLSQSNVNFSVSTSSGSTTCDHRIENLHIKMGNTSSHAKTVVNSSSSEESILDIQNTDRKVTSTNGHSREFQAEEGNIIIGRRRISSINYKRGDTLTLTWKDQNSLISNNGVCEHCTCCKHSTVNVPFRYPEDSSPITRALHNHRDYPVSSRNENKIARRIEWDTFSQLKKVSTQWREIAKRYVPKTDKEFWQTIRGDVVTTSENNIPKIRKIVNHSRHAANIITDDFRYEDEPLTSEEVPLPSGDAQVKNIEINDMNSQSYAHPRLFDIGDQTYSGTPLRVKEWDISAMSKSTGYHKETIPL